MLHKVTILVSGEQCRIDTERQIIRAQVEEKFTFGRPLLHYYCDQLRTRNYYGGKVIIAV